MNPETLCKAQTEIREDGFSIDLEKERMQWDAAIRAEGRRRAYRSIAECLCRLYRERYGREFLFTEKCVAFEIRFHADAYFSVTVGGYPRHIATLPFSKAALISHCKVIDISVDDVKNLKQRLMFGYRYGVRKHLRGTERDPFRRLK